MAEQVRNERFQNGQIGVISHLFIKTKVRYTKKMRNRIRILKNKL